MNPRPRNGHRRDTDIGRQAGIYRRNLLLDCKKVAMTILKADLHDLVSLQDALPIIAHLPLLFALDLGLARRARHTRLLLLASTFP